jgi:hypothetical protein
MINKKQDTLMNANICTHKQLGVRSCLQKSWEDAPSSTLMTTCVDHVPRTLENNL